MVDIVSPQAAGLQASLESVLIKTLSQAIGSVSSLPDAIASPSRPLVLTGTVVPTASGADPGEVTVQTSAGKVTVTLDPSSGPAPRGTVTVAIQPGSPPTASIVGQTAQSPAQTAQTLTPPPTLDATVTQAASLQTSALQTSPVPVLAAGQIVTATILPPVTPTGTPQPQSSVPAQAPASAAVSAQGGTNETSAAPPPTATLTTVAVAPSAATPSGPAYVAPAAQQPAPAVPVDANAIASPVPGSTNSAPQVQTAATQSPVQGPSPDGQSPALQRDPAASAPAIAYTSETQSFLVLKVVPPDQAATAMVDVDQEPPATSPDTPPSAAPSQPATSQNPPVTTTVIAQSQTNQPLLAAPSASFLLTRPAQVATGSEVTLQRVATPDGAGSARNAVSLPAALTLQPITVAGRPVWPALAQLLNAVQSQSPQVAASLVSSLPKAGENFVETFVAFLAPTKAAQDAAVADDMKALAQGTAGTPQAEMAKQIRELLTQAHADLGVGIKSNAASATPGSWHALPVPVMNGQGLEMLQMFVRQQIDPDGDKGVDPKRRVATTRFLVEISPRQVGPVQLDGLLRKQQNQAPRLDLIVRTTTTLPPEALDEMLGLFQTALVAANLMGGLRFQPGRENFVLPASEGGGHVTRMA